MRMKKLVVAALTVAISASSIFTAFAGWEKQNDGAWKYQNGQGYTENAWVLENNSWYYLGQGGIMKTGWITYQNQWYFLASNGVMQVISTELFIIWIRSQALCLWVTRK